MRKLRLKEIKQLAQCQTGVKPRPGLEPRSGQSYIPCPSFAYCTTLSHVQFWSLKNMVPYPMRQPPTFEWTRWDRQNYPGFFWFLHLPFLWNLENTPKYLWLYFLNPEIKQEEIPKISQWPSSVNVPLWLQQEGWAESAAEITSTMADTLQTRKPRIQKYHLKRVLSHLNNKLPISSYFFKNDSFLTSNYDSTLHWLLSFIFFSHWQTPGHFHKKSIPC